MLTSLKFEFFSRVLPFLLLFMLLLADLAFGRHTDVDVLKGFTVSLPVLAISSLVHAAAYGSRFRRNRRSLAS
jgi:hypothetical protein